MGVGRQKVLSNPTKKKGVQEPGDGRKPPSSHVWPAIYAWLMNSTYEPDLSFPREGEEMPGGFQLQVL